MDISQYLNVFMDECQEHLSTLNQSLLALENNPESSELLDAIFRAAHTLKGASATMGFNKMASVTHTMEDVLSRLRSKEMEVTSEIINALFDSFDMLEVLARGIGDGKEEDIEVTGVVTHLRQFITSSAKPSSGSSKKERRKSVQLRYTQDERDKLIARMASEGTSLYHINVTLASDCLLKGARVFMILREVQQIGTVVKSNPSMKDLEDENFDDSFILGILSPKSEDILLKPVLNIMDVQTAKCDKIEGNQILVERRDSGPELAVEIVADSDDKKRNAGDNHVANAPKQVAVSQTVRVDIHKLDSLMNLLAELVISRSRLEQLSTNIRDGELSEVVEHVGRLTLDLRDQVLKTRMVPIDNVFSRLPRLVRDLSHSTNKDINLMIEGGETELDRTVIDEIGDPLLHIIRNSVDHGVEAPEERLEKGKPQTGTVLVKAYQQGNSVMVVIMDDGKGIDSKRVAAKALQMGKVTEAELAEMTEDQKVELIFLPGLSTAEKVTDVSGRGVGMDVVHTKINELGGTVQIHTEKDQGTTFTIMLPVTVSIIQTLMVEVGNETYAIPTSYVESTISLMPGDIKMLRNQEVTMLRGEVLPLIRLQNFLDVPDAKNPNMKELDVVVIRVGDKMVGCIVDNLLRPQDVVTKPLGSYLGNLPGIAGATILGDGRVALIIDFRAVA